MIDAKSCLKKKFNIKREKDEKRHSLSCYMLKQCTCTMIYISIVIFLLLGITVCNLILLQKYLENHHHKIAWRQIVREKRQSKKIVYVNRRINLRDNALKCIILISFFILNCIFCIKEKFFILILSLFPFK